MAFNRLWSMFQLCGVAGLLLGTALALMLARRSDLSRDTLGGLLAMGVATFLTLTMVTKMATGREALVYYHHQVAVFATSAAALVVMRQPVLLYLDTTALGLGVILACGRCGCLLAGCCHGRPHRWGVRYGAAHAAEGFPACYVGVRLFPVQAVESLVVLSIVFAGSLMVLHAWPAGSALSWYVVSYSAARVWLEEWRGDSVRLYWLRLSEAQWTSLVLIGGIVTSEWLGGLPFSRWHLFIGAAAGASLTGLALGRPDARAVVQPRHAAEIAAFIADLPHDGGAVSVRRTSFSVGISTQSHGRPGASDAFVLFSLSRADRHLTRFEARALARLILNLLSKTPSTTYELLPGRRGVFHLIGRTTS